MRKRSRHALLLAERGVGPLLRRDYWAVIRRCRVSPARLMEDVKRHFASFAPSELVVFTRSDGRDAALEPGDDLEVKLAGDGRFRVRVLHANARSLTLGTEEGHPEAGRITFGSYRNRRGDVLFHIRSHARSSSSGYRAGFLAWGEVMQTSTWTDFVNRVAVAFGNGVVGFIHAETGFLEDEPPEYASCAPTFEARGG
ncbi:DUF1990 family protein [Vulgatibacter incomptus]|uniref:DUF1990 domain-containing protein n=1 Tax=Vulgatibacter incomptus TaxID=1391653 RepID=A0A0K1PHU8_9BACT|nr:DUF1990 family protein [Vulgatibacter incomptus]AKU93113.1 hypothetical protein AKJ08_3500 [Vulgatibacter incomptus]